jgi:hypothetical protein
VTEAEVTNPFSVDVEPDTLAMCQEMCGEARGPLACPALGFICEMQRERYPLASRTLQDPAEGVFRL